MIALIDYDNVDALERRRGVRHVMASLLEALGPRRVVGGKKLACRLYGGWFDEASLSPNALQLLPELRREFPSAMAVTDRRGTQNVLVRAELALTLACDPSGDLTHTYRQRSPSRHLRCAAAPFPDCADVARCPIASIEPFIRDKRCPVEGCAVRPATILHRAEQKLVDSMIVVDLIHLAGVTSGPLVVVSADDDLWPGIRFVLLRGARVIHVIPRRGRAEREQPYRHLETAMYTQVAM